MFDLQAELSLNFLTETALRLTVTESGVKCFFQLFWNEFRQHIFFRFSNSIKLIFKNHSAMFNDQNFPV